MEGATDTTLTTERVRTTPYTGPACLTLTVADAEEMLKLLIAMPSGENGALRRRVERFIALNT